MSDRTGRKPPGALARHPADWFSDELFSVGFSTLILGFGVGQDWFEIGCLNSDSGGRVMKCYGCSALSDGGSGLEIYFVRGSIGAQQDVAHSIRPDRAAPNVTSWFTHSHVAPGTPNPYPATLGERFGKIETNGFDGGTYLSPFPLFIVPVGYSIVATNLDSSLADGCYWWFTMADR